MLTAKRKLPPRKTKTHFAIQQFFTKQHPHEPCHLEYPFGQISRIADIFLPQKNLVFEIQCSFISSLEVEQRVADYNSLGIKVVWILHEKIFNQDTLLSAETFLQNSPHYFTNIDGLGKGIIYDQFSLVQKQTYLFKSNKLPIKVIKCCPITELRLPKQLPSQLRAALLIREKRWRLTFEKDLCNRCAMPSDPWIFDLSSRLKSLPPQKKREGKILSFFHWSLRNALEKAGYD